MSTGILFYTEIRIRQSDQYTKNQGLTSNNNQIRDNHCPIAQRAHLPCIYI